MVWETMGTGSSSSSSDKSHEWERHEHQAGYGITHMKSSKIKMHKQPVPKTLPSWQGTAAHLHTHTHTTYTERSMKSPCWAFSFSVGVEWVRFIPILSNIFFSSGIGRVANTSKKAHIRATVVHSICECTNANDEMTLFWIKFPFKCEIYVFPTRSCALFSVRARDIRVVVFTHDIFGSAYSNGPRSDRAQTHTRAHTRSHGVHVQPMR